jgi:hypothetical protein
LDLPIKTLEQIVYFAAYIVIAVDDTSRDEAEKEITGSMDSRKQQLKREYDEAKQKMQEVSYERVGGSKFLEEDLEEASEDLCRYKY